MRSHRPALGPLIFQGKLTVRGKIMENEKKIQVRRKSGNFIFSQGNLVKMKKIIEKSEN